MLRRRPLRRRGGCSPQPETNTSGKESAKEGSKQGCAPGGLDTEVPGKLTVGTDKPAYAPWFDNDEPSNGKGFESAVAYAVAERLGYDRAAVVWQTVPFNSSFAPGAKTFDFDINQVSISNLPIPNRAAYSRGDKRCAAV